MGLLVIDERGTVRACGESLASLLGRDADELAGKPVWMLVPGWSPFNGMGEPCRLRLAASGSSIPVRICGNALHLAGETLFILDVCRPPALSEPHVDAAMVTDRSGEILYVNPAFEAVTGFSGVEAAGMTPAILKSEAQDPCAYRELWDTILDGRAYRGQLVNRRKNGELYREDKVIRPVLDARGRPAIFLSSGRAVTPRMSEADAFLGRSSMVAAAR